MAIAYKASSVSSRTTGGTSMTATLPTFAAGDLLIAWFVTGDSITGLGGFTGWTQLPGAPDTDGTTGYYDCYYKIADGSETSLSLTWTTNSKPLVTIVSYSGVDGTTPVVAADQALYTSNNSSVLTPTVNNTGSGVEWAVGLFAFRVTSSGSKSNTYTPDAALTERSDANESAAGSAPWMSAEVADSNGAVTTGNHSYTATVVSGGNSAHKAAALLYIQPTTSTTDAIAGVVAAQSTVAASLTDQKAMAAAVAGVSALTAALTDPKDIAAAVAGVSALTAALTDQRLIAAAIAGASALTGALTDPKDIAAVVTAVSALTGVLTDPKAIAAAVAGISALTAALTTTAGATVLLAADVTAQSTVAALLSDPKALAATITAVSGVAVSLSDAKLIAAALAGASTVAVVLTDQKTLAAVTAGRSVVAASITGANSATIVAYDQTAVLYITTF